MFSWRVGHGILPKNEKIKAVVHLHNKSCLRCGAVNELLIHALKDCPKAHAVLSYGAIDGRILNFKSNYNID